MKVEHFKGNLNMHILFKQEVLFHSCEFPTGYCHKVKIGWTFTKMGADHTIL